MLCLITIGIALAKPDWIVQELLKEAFSHTAIIVQKLFVHINLPIDRLLISIVFHADSPILRLLNENSDSIDPSLITHENRRVNITCEVNANPLVNSGDIKWMKGETLVHTGISYVIDPVHRSHAGDYKCQATNQMLPSGKSPLEGSGMKSMQLRVLCKYENSFKYSID